MYVNSDHNDWDLYLKAVCFAYNTSVCTESTQFTPFYLMFGRMPIHPIDSVILPHRERTNDAVQDAIVKLQEARTVARQNVMEAQERMKSRYDRTANPLDFKPGDLVWIYFPQIKVGGSRKFFNNYSGPYILLKKNNNVNFEVAHAHNNEKLKNQIHVNRMKKFTHRYITPLPLEDEIVIPDEDDTIEDLHPIDQGRISNEPTEATHTTDSTTESTQHQQSTELPYVLPFADSQEDEPPSPDAQEYEINKVIKARYNKEGNIEYLIDWKGYPASERSYEPYENLNNFAREYIRKTKIPITGKKPSK